jgi:hypothetical protein
MLEYDKVKLRYDTVRYGKVIVEERYGKVAVEVQ